MLIPRLIPPLALCLALLTLLVVGCADGLTGTAPSVEMEESKLRHAHLLDRARRHGRHQVAGKGPNALGLVVKMRSGTLLERYSLEGRYTMHERYAFREILEGVAITIEDTTGGRDFSAILDSLSKDPSIEWLEPDFSIDLPSSSEATLQSEQRVPWSVAWVGGKESSSVSGDGTGRVQVDVFVIDTGVSSADLRVVEHVDLVADTSAVTPDPSDRDGHGTHVAGTIAALDDHRGLVGVAPGARIHNLKVIGDAGTTDVSVVLAALDHVLTYRRANPSRPMVVNLSLGENIGTSSYTALDEAVEHLIRVGVTVVVAAGNQGTDASLVTPAHVTNAITVGAHNAAGDFAAFSNHGPVIDILAPGVDVVSLAPDQSGLVASTRLTGTSMSAPHVAGAAALYLSSHSSASPAEVLDALLASSKPGIRRSPAATTNRYLWVGAF